MNEETIKIIDEKYAHLSLDERKEIYEMYFSKETRDELKRQLEKVIFYSLPPTVDEFLDPANGWLSVNIINTTFPHIKEELRQILDPSRKIIKVVEYGATRLGKTYMARLLILYTIIYIHHLREPAMYYGLSPLTRLCIYFISFKFDKTRQLYLEPMFEIMRQSKRFKQVKFEDKVREFQKQVGRETIVWSKAATSGEITLASGLQLQMGNNDALSVIGSDILQAYISEIGFFCEYAGATEEKIFELYTNVSTRIYSTVKDNYLAFVYLDTSANNADSKIEKHIIGELQSRDRVHFKWQSQWEARPDLFPIWQKTGETFKVITGGGSIPARIVVDEKEIIDVPVSMLIDVPIDAKQTFKDNLLKEIKDIAGRPTQAENKFITDMTIITDIFDNPSLRNIEGLLYADASDMPEGLLWRQLQDIFFFKNVDSYQIRRAPREPRFIGLDTSYSIKGDATGFTVLHKEFDVMRKEVVYVVDFTFAIGGTDKGINLEAVPVLLIEMITKASMPISALYCDTFQSETSKQFLERNNVRVIKQSVDRDVTAYQVLSTIMSNRLVKAGRNVFLRNNLNALMLSKTDKGKDKIDHLIGTVTNKYLGDYEHSLCGTFAKDVSDSLANAVYGAFSTEYIPSTIYQEENKKFSVVKEDVDKRIEDAYSKLHKYY